MLGGKVTRQDPLEALSDEGRLERWTIDELLDGRVRLLTSIALRSDATKPAWRLPAMLSPGQAASPAPEASAVAMEHELAPALQAWTEETAVVVDEAELADFLAGRLERGGLPGTRPLREGDVFWVFVPAAAERRLVVTSASDIGEYREAGAVVLDLTAAARQAAKVRSRRAEAAGSEEPKE
jgi:hypothetical protein